VVERALSSPIAVAFRQPTEADHARYARLAREWWDDRPPRIERFWMRHFGPTTLLAEAPDGRPLGLAIGFRGSASSEPAGRGVLHLVAVAPGVRRRGIGRALAAAVEERLVAAGATSVEAVVWPGNRVGVRFLEALGFEPIPESRSTPLFGVPAIANYDGEGEDRSVLVRELPRSSTI
jgi:ribosomal protein S18 acetylase RimI-like enzyme